MPVLLKVFLRTLLDLPFKCCCNNIILPCGHSRQPRVTRKQFPSLSLRNECGRVARGYGNCFKRRRVAGDAYNKMENSLSI